MNTNWKQTNMNELKNKQTWIGKGKARELQMVLTAGTLVDEELLTPQSSYLLVIKVTNKHEWKTNMNEKRMKNKHEWIRSNSNKIIRTLQTWIKW